MPQSEDPGRARDPSGQDHKPRPRKRLPSQDTILSESTLTSPQGKVYRVLRTNQTDAYDPPLPKSKDRPAQRKGKRRQSGKGGRQKK
jgi:hypothetical protein